jgi:maltooligosyltrehalose trehalohydrolase
MIAVAATEWGPRLLKTGGVDFRIWAPAASRVRTVVLEKHERIVDLNRREGGWFCGSDAESGPGTRYLFEIDGVHRVPDPASRFQPEGVHGPSEVIDPGAFVWSKDGGSRASLADLVFYELHVGTFTPEGTFLSAIERLAEVAQLGVTAIELMPVAQAAGLRNWGYDGVLLYAPSHAYGRPEHLKQLIASAHELGLSVFLDVVYNHFGPEGNYIHLYAPQYFTDRHGTPWGAAIDYSSPWNDPVRDYAIENACYWLEEYRFDGLRLDAVETIYDERPYPILRELADRVGATVTRPVHLVLENDQNNVVLLEQGYDAQWNDDVHHIVHSMLTGECDGYYGDYVDSPASLLGRALTSGFAYQGEPSPFRGGRQRGTPSGSQRLVSFVNFLQNHDQIGNRAFGERLSSLVSPEALQAAVAIVLLAPSPPLLFMGEEWAASTPFQYFCDFEPALAPLVRDGRRREFSRFEKFSDESARELIPDPGARETFMRSKLNWSERDEMQHRRWLWTYGILLELRRTEIGPRVAHVTGAGASFRVLGSRGLSVSWNVQGGVLRLDANVSEREIGGFDEYAEGRTLYTTHGDCFFGGVAPPWSVRWSLK